MDFITLTFRQAVYHYRAQSLISWSSGLLFLLALLINLSFGYEFRILDLVGFYCLLSLLELLSFRIFKLTLIFSSLLAACYFPFGRTYGAPNFNSVLSLYSSNFQEAGEILQVFPVWYYLVSLVIGGIAFVILRTPDRSYSRWSGRHSFFLTGFLTFLFFMPLNAIFSGSYSFSILKESFPIVHFIRDLTLINMTVNQQHQRMQELSALQDDWHVLAVKPKHRINVIVIGESVRRDAMGAFGGQWDNTPFISKSPGVLFQNYLAAASSTQQSLGLTLTLVGDDEQPQYQNNIVTLAKRAGFKTYWFSNQGQFGNYDTAIASIAKRSDQVSFLKNGNFNSQDTSDMELLNFTNKALAEDVEAPKLIIYHLMGSHPKACERTHHQYVHFVDNDEISCYLYSITQTDNFLAELKQQLLSHGQSFSMIYFSDHGLSFKERGTQSEYLSHNDQFQQNYQVPMFMTSSTDNRQKVVKAMRSANDFMLLFAEWTGISSQEIIAKYRFVSEQQASSIYVTNFVPKRIDYHKLPEDPFVQPSSHSIKLPVK